MIYFDNAATTRPSAKAIAAMRGTLEDCFGNPSSLHDIGLQAEHVVKQAAKTVSSLLGVTQGELIWTSGGTEANNLAILGAARASIGRGKRVITSAVEHPSVAEAFAQLAAEGFDVVVLPVDADGRVSTDALSAAVNGETTLVSIMHVNNETGIMQDIEELSKAAKAQNRDILFHCDAVQSFGKHPLSLNRWNIDLLTASAHKIHGTKGSGLLYARYPARLKPIIHGGGQQKGIRPGTENVAGIAAFGAAAAEAFAQMDMARASVTALRDRLLQIPETIENVRVNSRPDGSPYIVNMSFDGVRAEVLLHALEAEGFAVSAGSACSSKHKYSQVLVNHGLTVKQAEEAIRISPSPDNTLTEAEAFAAAINKQIRFLRKYGGVRR